MTQVTSETPRKPYILPAPRCSADCFFFSGPNANYRHLRLVGNRLHHDVARPLGIRLPSSTLKSQGGTGEVRRFLVDFFKSPWDLRREAFLSPHMPHPKKQGDILPDPMGAGFLFYPAHPIVRGNQG